MTSNVARRCSGTGVMVLVLLGALTSGCATKRPPPAPATPAPVPTSTTTCFQLQVYDPATRQYKYQQICSTQSTPQSSPKLD